MTSPLDRAAPGSLLAQRIFLYGPPGSGKSSLGRLLADGLDLPFCDLDSEIEAQAGKSIPELFKEEGEPGFRARERACLASLLDRPFGVAPLPLNDSNGNGVAALGGGSLLDPESRALVESCGQVLCLRASPEALGERLRGSAGLRPLLGDPADAGRIQ